MTTRDLESEMALLGAVLHDPSSLDAMASLDPGDFFLLPHGEMLSAMRTIYDAHGDFDATMLMRSLAGSKGIGQLGDFGDYLAHLAESAATDGTLPYHVKRVADLSRARRLIVAAEQAKHALEHGGDPDGVAASLESALRPAARQTPQDAPWGEAMLESVADTLCSGGVQGVPSGFIDVDNLLGGFKPGEFVVLAARPSIGKTALAFQFAVNAAERGVPVAFFSLEMSKQALAARLIQARSRFIGYHAAAKVIASLPLHVEDRSGVTASQIMQRLRVLIRDHGVKIAFIDYIGLIAAERGQSPYERMSALSKAVKNLAREADIPIVCLAQINRSAANREDNRPQLSDLRDSGQIEEDCDVAAFIHREEYYHRGDAAWNGDHQDKAGLAELLILKNRNGRAGVVRLDFEGRRAMFHDRARGDAA